MTQKSFSNPLSGLSGYSYRSLPQLPPGEHERFLSAWRLLGAGGILALTRDGDIALSGAGVCEALLTRSWAARYRDPEEMLRLAMTAREVAAGLRTRDLGSSGVAAMQARAWGELANAFRVAGRPDEAESAFEEAFGREEDLGDPHLTAHLVQLSATFHGGTGDSRAAVQLLALVAELYDGMDEPHLGGRTRITQSIYASIDGRNDDALKLNEEGLARIDRTQDPTLAAAALHNRLLLLLRLGCKQEAKSLIETYGGFAGNGPLALRLRWMEGRILHALGDLEEAEAALRHSRDGLATLGHLLFAAIASLDLAATLLLQNRFHDAQAEALTAQNILLGLDNRAQYFAALVVLQVAFSSGGVTTEMVERALALLRLTELERGSGSR